MSSNLNDSISDVSALLRATNNIASTNGGYHNNINSEASQFSDGAVGYASTRATTSTGHNGHSQDDVSDDGTAPAGSNYNHSSSNNVVVNHNNVSVSNPALTSTTASLLQSQSVASCETPTQAFSEGLYPDDDSFTTIRTEKSIRDNYKMEFSFAPLDGDQNDVMEISNTSVVVAAAASQAAPRVRFSGNDARLLAEQRAALGALAEEETIDSERAVGIHVHEDDAYSIATERSFTGAMINLVIHQEDKKLVTGSIAERSVQQEEDESDLMEQDNDDNVADGTDANDVQQVAADDEISVVTAD